MPRDLTAGVDTALDKDNIVPIFLAKIDTAGGWVRYWTGLGTLIFNSENYLGTGDLGNISNLKESADLTANGISLTLSGVGQDKLSIALSQIEQGRDAIVFMGFFDNTTGDLIVDPYEIFTGITDIPIIKEQADTATIGITCENRLVGLNTPKLRRYTKEDQEFLFPGDLGFDYVPAIQDQVIEFGNKVNVSANSNLRDQ